MGGGRGGGGRGTSFSVVCVTAPPLPPPFAPLPENVCSFLSSLPPPKKKSFLCCRRRSSPKSHTHTHDDLTKTGSFPFFFWARSGFFSLLCSSTLERMMMVVMPTSRSPVVRTFLHVTVGSNYSWNYPLAFPKQTNKKDSMVSYTSSDCLFWLV